MRLPKLVLPLAAAAFVGLPACAAHEQATQPKGQAAAPQRPSELQRLRMLQAEYQTAIARHDMVAIPRLDKEIAGFIDDELIRPPPPLPEIRTDAEAAGVGGAGVDLAAMRDELDGLAGKTDQTSLDRKLSMVTALENIARAEPANRQPERRQRDQLEERRDRLIRE